jgi:hypothetical protein
VLRSRRPPHNHIDAEAVKRFVGDLHHKELPRLCLRLARELNCGTDPIGLWVELERLLKLSLHMFSSGELITIYYALNFKHPKIGSLGLRDLVLKLILDDLKLLTLEEFMHFMATQVNNAKLTLFHTTFAELKIRLKEIAASSDPNIAANAFHLYVLTRIPFSQRKTRGIERNYEP